MSKSFRYLMNAWDAKYNFPKPAAEQHLSGYHAALKLMGITGWAVFYAVLGVLSIVLSIYTFNTLLELSPPSYSFWRNAIYIGFFISVLLVLIGFSSDLTTLTMPFWAMNQLLSHGSARWATAADLTDRDILHSTDKDLPDGYVRLVPYRNQQIALHHKEFAMGGAVMSPAGSGKSSLLFMHMIRSFSRIGGVIALDIKGELYEYTMHYFSRVYRLDIRDPRTSDHLDLFGNCYLNPTEAYTISAYILGFNPNKDKGGNPIWDRSAVSMLGLILLHIAQLRRNPMPRDILQFLSTHPSFEKGFDKETGEEKFAYPLHEAMTSSPDPFVRMMWQNQFRNLPAETYNSVKFNLDGYMVDFFNPKLTAILTPPTEREKRLGRKTITFEQLRKLQQTPHGQRGTALYVVVSLKDTKIMSAFLRTFFSNAIDTLRGSENTEVPILFAMDEAGNIPLYSVPEGINTDRSIGLCYWLGYQDMSQPASQFGDNVAETFISALNTYIFLPGIKGKTAKFASGLIGKTTILHTSSSDAKNDNFDSKKVSEASTDLMYETALREMPRFRKCIVVTGDCPPIYTAPNEDAKETDNRRHAIDGYLLESSSITPELKRALKEFNEKWTVEDQIDLQRMIARRDAMVALNSSVIVHGQPETQPVLIPAPVPEQEKSNNLSSDSKYREDEQEETYEFEGELPDEFADEQIPEDVFNAEIKAGGGAETADDSEDIEL